MPTSTSARTVIRALVSAALASAAILAGLPGSQRAAEAIQQDIVCPGPPSINTLQFNPGLRLFTQFVTMTGSGEYTSCASSDPNITSGTSTITGSGDFGCLSEGGTLSATEMIRWNTHETSTVEYTLGVTPAPGGQVVFVVAGEVTGGKFDGDIVTSEGAAFAFPVDCLSSPGLHEVTGPTTLTFTEPLTD